MAKSVAKLESRRMVLEEKHKQLDNQIQMLYKSYTDDLELKKLKVEKLAIKREIDEVSKDITNLTEE